MLQKEGFFHLTIFYRTGSLCKQNHQVFRYFLWGIIYHIISCFRWASQKRNMFLQNSGSKGAMPQPTMHCLINQFSFLITQYQAVENNMFTLNDLTYDSLKSIVLEPVIPMTRRSILNSSLRTAACTNVMAYSGSTIQQHEILSFKIQKHLINISNI